jgi:hypothetical protein
MKYVLSVFLLLIIVACTEKPKAIVHIDKNLTLPITCMKLNTIGVEKEFAETLRSLYAYDTSCPLSLNISYKKNIVCNSSYNSMAKSTGKFPKSFLKLELRKGLKVQYSYYVDLLDNVESEDVKEGFSRLKSDILVSKLPKSKKE